MNWNDFLFTALPKWRQKHPQATELLIALAFAFVAFVVTEFFPNGDLKQPLRSLVALTMGAFFFIAPLFLLSYLRQWESQTIPTKKMGQLLLRAEKVAVAFGGVEVRKFFNTILLHWYRPSQSSALYEQEAKKRFADDYLSFQIKTLENRTIHITTDAFTTLYWNLTRLLANPMDASTSTTVSRIAAPANPMDSSTSATVLHIAASANPKDSIAPPTDSHLVTPKFTRLHITGMLPEEFFNGPQIVYEDDVNTESSMPRIICHKWEEYYDEGFYPSPEQEGTPASRQMKDWQEVLRVKRYVLVRQISSTIPAVGALPTKEDLDEQKTLVINRNERGFLDLDKECLGVITRLFRKTGLQEEITKDRNNLLSLVNRLLEREMFHYFPVAKCDPCSAPHRCPSGRKWEFLLQAFHAKWHTSPKDCLFSVITDDVWTGIRHAHNLRNCFLAGHTPEIVLFGDGSESEWYFGLKGHYRPFTRDIKLSFLNSRQAKTLHEEFSRTIVGQELTNDKVFALKECHAA